MSSAGHGAARDARASGSGVRTHLPSCWKRAGCAGCRCGVREAKAPIGLSPNFATEHVMTVRFAQY